MFSGSSAIVLFSGGQDSTICLAYALSRFDRVETIGFQYGQRHTVEMTCRPKIIESLTRAFPAWTEKLGADHVIDLSVLGDVSKTALTDEIEIEAEGSGLPNTFVPGRNLIFLNFAGAVAWRRGIPVIVGGMCETDYSGYPDCRRKTLDAQQVALSLGMDRTFSIDTPLMWLDKAESWDFAHQLGGQQLIDIIVEETHTCYKGDRSTRHRWGYGCGECPACRLRAAGWHKWHDGVAA